MAILTLFIVGLALGSFINALVWRLHTKRKWWGKERSICPKCKHQLAAKDLVPVLSWLALRARCGYCRKPISAQYPAVELLTAAVFVLSYVHWPHGFSSLGIASFITWLAGLVLLAILFVYDARWMLLPNKLVALVTITSSVVVILLAIDARGLAGLLSAGLAALIIFGLFYVLFQASNGRWIGGGDVKLAPALGLLAGTPVAAVLLMFLASLIGTLISLPLLLTKRLPSSAKIPFGPLLITATIIVFLWGGQLINWYLQLIAV